MIVNGITIGQYIFDKIKHLTNNKVYPIIAENGTTYPFIVYTRDGVSSDSTKDGMFMETVYFSIKVVSNKYSETIETADNVRRCLTIQKDETNKVYDMRMTNISETFQEDSYIQTLTFEAKLRK